MGRFLTIGLTCKLQNVNYSYCREFIPIVIRIKCPGSKQKRFCSSRTQAHVIKNITQDVSSITNTIGTVSGRTFLHHGSMKLNKLSPTSLLKPSDNGTVKSFSRTFATSTLALSSTKAGGSSLENGASSLDVSHASVIPVPDVPVPGIENLDAASSVLLYPDFPLIQLAETGIQYLHDFTGLPWWGCVLLTSVLIRGVIMMPLTIYSHHNMVRLERLTPEVQTKMEALKREVGLAMHKHKWDQERARQEFNQKKNQILKELYVRDNCHPMKNTASFWFQLPIWVSVSFSLRNMSQRALLPELDGHKDCASLTTEGTVWFSDLTQVDSLWILPVMMGAVTLFNVERNYLQVQEVTRYRKFLTYFLRGVSLAFIPISASMPSIMVLYWVSSASLATSMNILIEKSAFRRLVGLPDLPEQFKKSLSRRARDRYL